MALHLTKIAYGASSVAGLRGWLEQDGGERRLTTRYLPKRHEEMAGASLYWIHEHTLIGRSPLLGFLRREEDARWWIRLEPRLILVEPRHKRAHQGWRYLAAEDAPPDLTGGAVEALPPHLLGELARIGLA